MSFVLLGSLLLILLNVGETISCPTGYNPILTGCYKINNGSTMTWSQARDFCFKDSSLFPSNETVPNAITHLLALENVMERNSLFYWMFAYNLAGQFWIDGIVSTSVWDWSNQSIHWYFYPDNLAIIGYGSNYKLVYSSNSSIRYQISDDVNQSLLYFICEYQVPCNETNDCGSNADCYVNLEQDVCVCEPGYTGEYCETKLDECLSWQCQNGGTRSYSVIHSCILFLFSLLFFRIDN